MKDLVIEPAEFTLACEALRGELRDFLGASLANRSAKQKAGSWSAWDANFSRELGARGWLGMTWPKAYGGSERSTLERYVVLEELLASGAPVAAHWVAERQSGPLLMRFSPDVLAPRIVPAIARGEALFCIGMSEPDSGSDLASIRSTAVRTARGWSINGRKVWTTGAHLVDYMIALVRTGDGGADRHGGMSQFLIDMKTPGLTVRPIVNQLGEHDFNEVTLDDIFVPDENLIGSEGAGWQQVTTELTYERSGPERYLSSTQLYLEMLDAANAQDTRHTVALGRVAAHYATLRQMSVGIAGMLAEGHDPAIGAAAVKDQGALVEQAMPDIANDLFGETALPGSSLHDVAQYTTMAAPCFSLRGGTREILRGIVAKGLGLR